MADWYRKLFLFILGAICIFFIVELFKKSILAGNYYRRLAADNAVQKVVLPAPRGIVYDRNDTALVKNEKKKGIYHRTYLFSTLYAHVLGYVGLPNKKSLQDISCGSKIAPNQYVGMYGLEKTFECRLRGTQGWAYVETDARGVKQNELAIDSSTPGADIYLTIDTNLQKAAQGAFADKMGAAIASNPQTGELYMLYSSPSFDPNKILNTDGAYEQLAQDEKKPLFNRSLSGIYPPGSIIKPLIALGALEDSVITADTEFEDTGELRVGGVTFGNWYFLQYGKKEGKVNVEKAIARSNDIFFYKIGQKSGVNRIKKWFDSFGLSQTSLSRFFPQQAGIIPDESWKIKNYSEKWYLGDTINISIGQGYILVNPVQIHKAIATIASSGKRCNLQIELGEQKNCTVQTLKQQNIKVVQEGMHKACETGGTAWPFFDFSVNGKRIEVGCKTGTAESQGDDSDPHAWFSVFAPYKNPSIVVTILVENGGEGSSVAAPIAKEILTKYFSLQ